MTSEARVRLAMIVAVMAAAVFANEGWLSDKIDADVHRESSAPPHLSAPADSVFPEYRKVQTQTIRVPIITTVQTKPSAVPSGFGDPGPGDTKPAGPAGNVSVTTGDRLYQWCSGDETERASAAGYADAIADVAAASKQICLDGALTRNQVTDIVCGYLRDNPGIRTSAAPGLVNRSLEAAFPCTSK